MCIGATFYYHFIILALTGSRMSPRYFTHRFTVRRAQKTPIIRTEATQRTLLRARVHELRAQGQSFPAIAQALGISVGTAWNLANTAS